MRAVNKTKDCARHKRTTLFSVVLFVYKPRSFVNWKNVCNMVCVALYICRSYIGFMFDNTGDCG